MNEIVIEPVPGAELPATWQGRLDAISIPQGSCRDSILRSRRRRNGDRRPTWVRLSMVELVRLFLRRR